MPMVHFQRFPRRFIWPILKDIFAEDVPSRNWKKPENKRTPLKQTLEKKLLKQTCINNRTKTHGQLTLGNPHHRKPKKKISAVHGADCDHPGRVHSS